MKETYIYVTVRLQVESNKPLDVDEFCNELEYSFDSNTDGVTIVDTELAEFELLNPQE